MRSVRATTEQGWAEVNGTRLFYESCGSGPTLLFLHGFTLDRRMWHRQIAALCTGFRTVAYDARGFGRSALPGAEPYKHCEDAAALCEHLALDPVIAIGHSIGAHQLLELALQRPDLVAGFVSVAMSGLGGIPFPDDVLQMFGAMRKAARLHGVAEAKRIWKTSGWFAAARERRRLATELDQMLADYSGWHWLHDNPVQSLEPSACERLDELQVPALIITGGRDLAYNDAVGSALARGIPYASRLELVNAGHMTNLEDPEAVNQAIVQLAVRCE